MQVHKIMKKEVKDEETGQTSDVYYGLCIPHLADYEACDDEEKANYKRWDVLDYEWVKLNFLTTERAFYMQVKRHDTSKGTAIFDVPSGAARKARDEMNQPSFSGPSLLVYEPTKNLCDFSSLGSVFYYAGHLAAAAKSKTSYLTL